MLLQEYLEAGAGSQPGHTAIVFRGDRRSYRDLDGQASRFAHALLRAGLCRGDRVLVYLENSPEAIVAVNGILKADGVFVVVNPQVKSEKLGFMLQDSGAAMLVTDARKAAELSDAAITGLRAVFVAGLADPARACSRWQCFAAATAPGAAPDTPPRPRNIDADLAALSYTSGFTGTPKAVMLTHRNIVAAIDSISAYLGNRQDDVILSVLPLAFNYGLHQSFLAFRAGATLVLERGFTYPHEVLLTAVREKVTAMPLVPTLATILVQMDLAQYDLSRLRYVTNAAAALPVSRIRQLRERLPHVRVFSMYGQTECTRVCYLPPDQIDARPGSVGIPIPNEELYIVDEGGNRVGPGIEGELVVRGAHVMAGYWNQPEATGRALRPGPVPGERVLHTGDLFRMDEEGYFYFVGRRDDIIKTRGEKVAPREVEEIISRLPGVADAVVFGVPDTLLGHAVAAAVTAQPGATITADAVRRHCARHLEDFMVPRIVEIREALPQTTTGKLDRRALQHAAAGRTR